MSSKRWSVSHHNNNKKTMQSMSIEQMFCKRFCFFSSFQQNICLTEVFLHFFLGMRADWILTDEERINKKLKIEENRRLRRMLYPDSSSDAEVRT